MVAGVPFVVSSVRWQFRPFFPIVAIPGEAPGGWRRRFRKVLWAKVPTIPLPKPDAVTESRVVDTSKGLYKAEPPPKPKEEPDAQKIPEFKEEKQPHYITPPSKILEDKTPPPPNAIPYGGGGTPALPYSSSQQQPAQPQQAQQQQFSVSGATQGGMAFSGPGGGDFSGRFPSYVEAVSNRISSNWLQSSVDPSLPWAPRATIVFQILRDGTVTNIQLLQSSGNSSVDRSAVRAVQSSSPMSPLPSGYSGNNVTVEFWFDFRR